MSLGSWDPKAEQAKADFQIDSTQLKRFIDISQQQQLEQLSELLSPTEQQIQSALMQQDKDNWLNVAEALDNEELIALIRFFTVAEQLPGWEAGEQSPVIPLAKTLRKRGQPLDKTLLLWIKANSSNQYLPYGPLI